MKKIFSLLIWFVCALVCRQYAAGYWVVGPVFALAVFLVNRDKVFGKISAQHVIFTASSTLIYALVYRLADKGWKLSPDWFDMLAGGFTAGVVLGSVLLPCVHMLLFGGNFKEVRSVTAMQVISWYVILLLSWGFEKLDFRQPVDFMFVAIAVWQGIYLKRMKL